MAAPTSEETRVSSDDLEHLDEEQQTLLNSSPPPMASDVAKPEGRNGDAAAKVIVWASFAVFVLSTWAIILSNDPASLGWFKFHPLFQSLAVGSFTYGVTTLQPTSQPQTKAAGLKRHQIATIVVGLPLIILGTLAMYLTKSSHGAPHFTTWHGTLGITSVAWLVVQALIGGSTVWFDGAFWGGGMKAKAMWKYHRLSGYILFPLMLFTAYLGGGRSDWMVIHSEGFVRLLAYTIAPLLIIVGIYTRARTSKMKFF